MTKIIKASVVFAGLSLFALVGQSQTKLSLPLIFGGDEVKSDDAIAHTTVSILNGKQFECSASIIDPHIIVTAAHCVTDTRYGTQVLSFGLDARGSDNKTVAVTEAVRNEGYNSETVDEDDIALMYFEDALPKGYEPITMLPVDTKLTKGDAIVLAGYGTSTTYGNAGNGILRKTTVPLSNPDFGKREITVDQSKGSGACYGDSGGPAIVQINKVNYLIGVTNRYTGSDCASDVVYASVQRQGEWIAKTADDLRKKHQKN